MQQANSGVRILNQEVYILYYILYYITQCILSRLTELVALMTAQSCIWYVFSDKAMVYLIRIFSFNWMRPSVFAFYFGPSRKSPRVSVTPPVMWGPLLTASSVKEVQSGEEEGTLRSGSCAALSLCGLFYEIYISESVWACASFSWQKCID